MEKTKLIGICASHFEDAVRLGEILHGDFHIARYDACMKEIVRKVLGFSHEEMEDDEKMKMYLGDDWSYIRQERFSGKQGIDVKPVKYHLTAEKILKRIQFLGREIHSNFWVNALFAQLQDSAVFQTLVIDVIYPNEADGITDHDGLLIKVNRPPLSRGHRFDYLEKHPNIHKMFITTGSDKDLNQIADELRKLI